MRSTVAVILCFAFMSGDMAAQITGRVISDAGNELPFVAIQLLAGDSVVAESRSDQFGRFDIRPVSSATHVRAETFGFEAAIVPLGDLMRPLDVVLSPAAFELTELRVGVDERSCPASPDEASRRELQRLLGQGAGIVEAERWAAEIVEYFAGDGAVRNDIVLDSDLVGYRAGGGGSLGVRQFRSRMRRGFPFAHRRQDGEAGGFGMAWSFEGFNLGAAPFLGVPGLFADADVERGSEENTFVACLRQDDGAEFHGTFGVENDRIREVAWRIRGTDPEESISGYLRLNARGPFLPERSYQWVEEADGRAQTVLAVFGPWFIGTDEEVRRGMRLYLEAAEARD